MVELYLMMILVTISKISLTGAHSSSAPVEEVKCFEKRSGRHDAKSTTLNLPGSLLKKLGHVFP